MADADEIERGHVVMFCERGGSSYGFIQPTWSSGIDRSTNVWFGMASMRGRIFSQGEEVAFVYARSSKNHSCPAAHRVFKIEEIPA